MISGKIRQVPLQYDIIPMKGGLNEQISNIQLKPGELIADTNYITQDDIYDGQESVKGYERFDGTPSPSDTALDTATPGSEVDTSREAVRAAIGDVPGTDNILGVHIFNDCVFAWRNTGAEKFLYKSSTSTSIRWGNGTTADTALTDDGASMAASGTVRAVTARFSLFPSGNANEEVMLWVDGVTSGFRYYRTGTAFTVYDENVNADLPSALPTHIGVWENRLFLVYPGGHILFSEVGDPTGWDAATGNAGEIYIGEDVTNVVEVPGGHLAFFTRNKIKVLSYGSTSNEFIFKLDDFSNTMGAIPDTTVNLLGTLYFADDRGFSSLSPGFYSGQLNAKFIGKKIYKTYIENRDNITFGTVDRDTNRYYLFYTNESGNASGLVFTFVGNKLKGSSKIVYQHKITSITEGKFSDGTNKLFFGSDDGYVYQMLSGTSFDGGVIATSLTTSYHHYGSPRHWKNFKRLGFEMTATNGTVFNIRPKFNYMSNLLANSAELSSTLSGSNEANQWGSGVWGTMVWNVDLLENPVIYIQGYGVNMAIQVNTSSKYRPSHIIHNIFTDYTLGGVQQ
jgi:hypothetical protein